MVKISQMTRGSNWPDQPQMKGVIRRVGVQYGQLYFDIGEVGPGAIRVVLDVRDTKRAYLVLMKQRC